MSDAVLVVDDEPFILRSLTFVLRRGGYEVLEAWNGEEGLALIREARPKIVFLDVMMPKMSGYEVCEAVRAEPWGNEIVIIMLTAKGQESDRQRGLDAGADEYMTKPFSPSRIVERVREILG
jgi:two-component system, OmpR family, alkaline phosphatase synthesis response regulator PhoP